MAQTGQSAGEFAALADELGVDFSGPAKASFDQIAQAAGVSLDQVRPEINASLEGVDTDIRDRISNALLGVEATAPQGAAAGTAVGAATGTGVADGVQGFLGALHHAGAAGGVFITTSQFTPDAISFARFITPRVILIDGPRLGRLMVTHGIGVQEREMFRVVEIDDDFFGDV
jgi:ribosomal protein L12E/L44/L45/RPP1/RPP2